MSGKREAGAELLKPDSMEDLIGLSQDFDEGGTDNTIVQDPEMDLDCNQESPVKSAESSGKKPKPKKRFKDMTPEEKSEIRERERKWKREKKAQRQRELDSQRFSSTPVLGTKKSSHGSDSNGVKSKKSMEELEELRLRLTALSSSSSISKGASSRNSNVNTDQNSRMLAAQAQDLSQVSPLPSGSAEPAQSVPKMRPSNSRSQKRNREEISDEQISMEKPQKKKMKDGISYRDATPEHFKLYINKMTQGERLTGTEVSLLASQLQLAVVKVCLEGTSAQNAGTPIITANFITKDGYCVVSGNKPTYEWVKSNFRKIFSLNNETLILTEGETLRDRHAATIFVPQPRLELAKLMQLIAKLNPDLQVEKWMVRNVTNHADGSTIIHLLVDDNGRSLIEARRCSVLCGIGLASVRFQKDLKRIDETEAVEMDTEDTQDPGIGHA